MVKNSNMKDKKLEELKKLPPEERIEKLRELAEKNRKEIEEAQKLIKESKQELEKKEKEKIDIPIPQIKAFDIESLFTEEEKEIYREKRFVRRRSNLERVVGNERQAERKTEEERQYEIKLSQEPIGKIYEMVKNIYNNVRETGEITEEQRQQLYIINNALERKRNDIIEGKYKTTDEAIEGLVSVTKNIMKYIRG